MEGVWIKVKELEKLKQQRDELLAVLEEISNHLHSKQDIDRSKEMARSAIAKVKP